MAVSFSYSKFTEYDSNIEKKIIFNCNRFIFEDVRKFGVDLAHLTSEHVNYHR